MCLVCEAEFGDQTREARLARGQSLERQPDPQPVSVARDRLACLHLEDSAQVMRRGRD
jgi:hypothetical protein